MQKIYILEYLLEMQFHSEWNTESVNSQSSEVLKVSILKVVK